MADMKVSQPGNLVRALPEEILWVRLNTSTIHGIKVKSYILISLPSISQFIGIRSDALTKWISSTTFKDFVLSVHRRHLYETQISGSWEKGIVGGYIPFIPLELIPEIIVSFRQSGRTVQYPDKAEMLYQLAKSTLESVGLAISGNKQMAAEELAKVSEGLGIKAADQIIAIFKRYETREFQVQTTKEFQSKVRQVGADYAVTIGTMTLGITGKRPNQWKTLGTSQKLPKKIASSSREVMRTISPGNSVGMTFGERHYIKEPKVKEAIKTGKQGKSFYERLKKVGLLED